MSFKQRTLEELADKRARTASRFAVVGLDGFVDTIVHPVSQRFGPGEAFEPITSLADLGARIGAAAGKSTNIELYPRMEKLGGNGPILANALHAGGMKVRYVGALGKPVIHPVFAEFAAKTDAVSLTEPSHTTAVECTDGKLMLGIIKSLDDISYDAIVRQMGEGMFLDMLSRADLIALVNWTMIPAMTDIFTALVERALPQLPPREGRRFFFDLADPQKRSRGDLKNALLAIAKFQPFGAVTLGLNLKEAQQVHEVLGFAALGTEPEDLRLLATQIRQELHLSCVVVHPRESAACATREDSWYVPGPYTDKPLITTGAGDHFNAGFALGQQIGLSPEACLTLGVSFSGHYVRTGQSPSLASVDGFIRMWK
jgi:hypothetical protein